MTVLIALAIGVLVGCGVLLLLRARIFPVLLGVMLMSYAVNLFLLASGRLRNLTPPILTDAGGPYADPLPQALVLTAIVIGFGMLALLVAVALRSRQATGTDHVAGHEPLEYGP